MRAGASLLPAMALSVLATAATAPASAQGTTERVSVGPGSVQANEFSSEPSISADGRFVAFELDATNLVPGDTNDRQDVFVRDRRSSVTRRVSIWPGGIQANNISYQPALSADGRFVAFTSEATNVLPGSIIDPANVFVRDRRRDVTHLVSVGPGGIQADGRNRRPTISANGRFVAFDFGRHQPGAGR